MSKRILTVFLIILLFLQGCIVAGDVEIKEKTVIEYADDSGLNAEWDPDGGDNHDEIKIYNYSGTSILSIKAESTVLTPDLSTEPDWDSLSNINGSSIPDSSFSVYSIGNTGETIDANTGDTVWLRIETSDDKYLVGAFTWNAADNWLISVKENGD